MALYIHHFAWSAAVIFMHTKRFNLQSLCRWSEAQRHILLPAGRASAASHGRRDRLRR